MIVIHLNFHSIFKINLKKKFTALKTAYGIRNNFFYPSPCPGIRNKFCFYTWSNNICVAADCGFPDECSFKSRRNSLIIYLYLVRNNL